LNTATRLADGTVAAPSLAFSSDPATGLVRLAAGVLGVVAAGAEVVRFGAWAQFAKRVAVSGADPVLVLDRASTAVESSIFGNVAGSSRWRLTLGDATAESGGNVGSNLTLIRYTDAGAYVDAPLAISRATGVVTCLDGLGVFDGSWSVSQDAAWRYQQVLNAAWRWQFNKSTGDMEWNANGAIFRFGGAGTYMDSPGGFRIKNATGADGSQALWDNNAGIRLLTFAGGWGFKWIVSNGSLVWTANGTDATQIAGNGDLSLLIGEAHKSVAGPWLGPSDERIKENIADYAAGLAQVIALRPRSYTFKPGGEVDPTVTHYGLISQEAQAVMPELVLPVPVLPDPPPPEDADAIRERSAWSYMRPLLGASQTEGEPVDVLFLNPNALTYALVNAVRELNAKVDTYVAAHP
jgi:hypothetical protein